jgi:hypothetical protein
MKRASIGIALAGTLAACVSAWGSDAAGNALQWVKDIPMKSAKPFAFDISASSDGNYYVADSGEATLDVIDAKTLELRDRISANFAGLGPTHDKSGPSGIVPISGTSMVYVGDVNAVKLIDVASKQLVKTIPVSSSGLRADEGCLDPEHHIVMFSSGAEEPPFATFINTDTQSVIAKITFNDSSGLEACAYDPKGKNFMINNDGTKANPTGEVDTIPADSVLQGHPAVSRVFALKGCHGPSGLALGPGNDALVGCDPDEGKQTTLIIDRSNGTTLAELPFGGTDETVYDPASNRYFLAAGHHSTDNVSRVKEKGAKFDPALGIIDAGTRSIVGIVPTAPGAHSVAVDGDSHHVFIPHGSGATAQFTGAGVSVFATE